MFDTFGTTIAVIASLVSVIAAVLGKRSEFKQRNTNIKIIDRDRDEFIRAYKEMSADGKFTHEEIRILKEMLMRINTDLSSIDEPNEANKRRTPEETK
jgi:hypothetical protein